MSHMCLMCYGDTSRFLVCQVGPFIHGFSICENIDCVVSFRMSLRPGVLIRGSQLWE